MPEGANLETRVREGRTALAITVLMIVALTVPTMIVGGGFGVAEAQQSPSPTGTAPTIELVNPSDYEGTPVLSDKDNNPGNDSSGDDPQDEQYHFNSWTRNAPNDASVEFFIVQGSNQISLGLATNRGGGVYDLFSGIPDNLTEGTATVRVILYSGGGEVDRDEEGVTVNEKTESSVDETALMQGEQRATNEAETLEILYPQNIGGVGFFGRPGQPKAANIEIRHSRTGTAGTGSGQRGGPENIRAYYTVSHRGTDPEWKACGTESQTDSANGVRCELQSSDQPEWVTGIAAVTRDSEVPATNPGGVGSADATNAGDAHVAVGYTQTPTGVLVGSPQGAQSVPGCSPLIPVTVTDQIGREITGAPLDVHAQGPTDSLSFVTERDLTGGAGEPHDNKPPESHSTEQSRKCDGTLSDELQGEHEEAGTLPDRKHIESLNGTDGDGQFVYRMWSNAAGGTTMTAFVDMDDNDRHCSTEASGNGIINWGSGGPSAPLPSGPEEQACPSSASGSASGTTTASPSGSASATPSQTATSASPSRSASASPTATASRSASPSTTPSQTSPTASGTATTSSPTGPASSSPQQSGVEVTLETSQPRKTFGKTFTLTGSVSSDNAACTDLVNVRILRDVVGGDDEFELWAQETTDANGAFAVNDRADVSASYIAEVAETATCDDATSAPQPVLVRAKVTLRLSRNKVDEGGSVRFTITTAPCPLTARDRVLLFRAIEGTFGKAGSKQTNQRCVAAITRRINKSSVFQARWPKQTAELLAGKSRSKAVRVTD